MAQIPIERYCNYLFFNPWNFINYELGLVIESIIPYHNRQLFGTFYSDIRIDGPEI